MFVSLSFFFSFMFNCCDWKCCVNSFVVQVQMEGPNKDDSKIEQDGQMKPMKRVLIFLFYSK